MLIYIFKYVLMGTHGSHTGKSDVVVGALFIYVKKISYI